MGEYVTVYRSKTNGVFRSGEAITLHATSKELKVELTADLSTRYSDVEDYDAPYPGPLVITVYGVADDFPVFQEMAHNHTNVIAAYICVIANCAVEDPICERLYDRSPGVERRLIVEFTVVEGQQMPIVPRVIPDDAVNELAQAVDRSSDPDRLFRAISHYQMALDHWRPGDENRVMPRLWSGMEALTPLARKQYCETSGVPDAGLAEHFGVEAKKVDSKIREVVLFQGDATIYKKAHSARNAWEHSFERFHLVRKNAEEARDATARYLRQAIFDFVNLSKATKARLLHPPYIVPYGNWAPMLVVRGHLVGASVAVAAKGELHPLLRSKFSLNEYRLDPAGYPIPVWGSEHDPLVADGLEFQVHHEGYSFPAIGPDTQP